MYEGDYPYTAKSEQCKPNDNKKKYSIKNFV